MVANVLDTRKTEVILITKNSEEPVTLTAEDIAKGTEIEEILIPIVVRHHAEFCAKEK